MVDQNPEGTGGAQPAAASSLSDMLEHLARMTYSLEKAWSEGLSTETAAAARREAKEVWTTFNYVKLYLPDG